MQILKAGTSCCALLEKTDRLQSREDLLKLLDSIFAADCRGILVPVEMIGGALKLLNQENRNLIMSHYSDKAPRVALVGQPNRIVLGVIKGFLKQMNLEDAVGFYEDVNSALSAFTA